MKALSFLALYILSFARHVFGNSGKPGLGLSGEKVFTLYDPKTHGYYGVVVFKIPSYIPIDHVQNDLWGPFGYSSNITFFGLHLYGRDTWGIPDDMMIRANQELGKLESPNYYLMLAGVRRIFGQHIYPLNNAELYQLKVM